MTLATISAQTVGGCTRECSHDCASLLDALLLARGVGVCRLARCVCHASRGGTAGDGAAAHARDGAAGRETRTQRAEEWQMTIRQIERAIAEAERFIQTTRVARDRIWLEKARAGDDSLLEPGDCLVTGI